MSLACSWWPHGPSGAQAGPFSVSQALNRGGSQVSWSELSPHFLTPDPDEGQLSRLTVSALWWSLMWSTEVSKPCSQGKTASILFLFIVRPFKDIKTQVCSKL